MCGCFVRIVLFVKGSGADPSTYRPQRETQWWGRRDALVRCVAAFLFGPTFHYSNHPSEQPPDAKEEEPHQLADEIITKLVHTTRPKNGVSERELVLVFDEDAARLHMTYHHHRPRNQTDLVPTEELIISIWKKATAAPTGYSVEYKGFTCRLHRSSPDNLPEPAMPTALDDKRAILAHLQLTCNMEFLRKHGLNSSPAVILRKTNKRVLMDVWHTWKQELGQPRKFDASAQANHYDRNLHSILMELIQPSDESTQRVVAATLHESSQSEFAWWSQRFREQDRTFTAKDDDHSDKQLCLFLGAVRDMTNVENRYLEQVCQEASIPLLAVRFGPVAEFTSKILSVVAFHHCHKMLWPTLDGMLSQERILSPSITRLMADSLSPALQLHFVCCLPIQSSDLSVELKDRDRNHWCLVRSVVASLWRSHVAGKQASSCPLVNLLTVMFVDGVVLSLSHDDVVAEMAQQHQAAPSEYQVLSACQSKLAKSTKLTIEDWDTKLDDVLREGLTDGSLPVCVLDMKAGANQQHSLARLFYSQQEGKRSDEHGKVVVLLPSPSSGDLLLKNRKMIVRASKSLKIPVLQCSLWPHTCRDEEASTITVLQHFCYQGKFRSLVRLAIAEQEAVVPRRKKRRKA